MWLTPLPLFQGVQPAAAGHRGAERPLCRCLPAALPPLEGAARDHRRRWLLPQGFVCLSFPAPNFPWGNNNLKTPPSVFSHIPAQCQGLPCPRSPNIHSLILTLRFFHNFSLSQCVKGCFSSHFAPQRDAMMGQLKVGDTWGRSLLPRLARNHSLIPIHELLTPERVAVSGTNVSLGNRDPAGAAGLQLCPTFPGFQSQGA